MKFLKLIFKNKMIAYTINYLVELFFSFIRHGSFNSCDGA